MGISMSNGFGNSNFFSFFATHKRSTIAFASAFATAGLITTVTVNAQTDDSPISSNHSETSIQSNTPASSSVSTDQTPSVTSTSTSHVKATNTSTVGTDKNVQLNVNGQDVAVPDNGSASTTIPTIDGTGQTSVDVNSNTAAGGTNNSSSSLNVNISSGSTSSGTSHSSNSTVIMQNGGTTIVHSN